MSIEGARKFDQATAGAEAADRPNVALAWLPTVDYERHPAYGGALPKPTLGARLRALALFARYLGFVGVKWLIDYEHLPLLTKDWGAEDPPTLRRIALPYLGMMLRVKGRRVLDSMRGRRRVQPPADPAVLDALRRDGIVCLRQSAAERARLLECLRPAFEELERRRRSGEEGGRDFEDSRLWLSRERMPEVYRAIDTVFEARGITAAARAYLGRPVVVKNVNPQINDVSDDFWRDQFADVGIPNPRTAYLHVDAGFDLLKCMIYVGEVTAETGPFCYVRGSNRAKVGFWEALVRRTNDHAGLSSSRRQARELFLALPRSLRRKCAFGTDLIDGSPTAEGILESELVVTSSAGDLILFDPRGIHRGGMVTHGERRAVTVLLAET